jgi:hypothetical protein
LTLQQEESYADVIKKKWYLLIEEDKALVYNSYYNITRCGPIDGLKPEDFPANAKDNADNCADMLSRLKAFNGL